MAAEARRAPVTTSSKFGSSLNSIRMCTDHGSPANRAFSSPNMSPLAKIGISIDVDWRSVLRPTVMKPFQVHKNLCQDVATLRLFPGITTSSVKAFLGAPLKGVGTYTIQSDAQVLR